MPDRTPIQIATSEAVAGPDERDVALLEVLVEMMGRGDPQIVEAAAVLARHVIREAAGRHRAQSA